MASTYLPCIQQGLAANRPIIPDTPRGCLAFYYATDTDVLSVYVGNTWSIEEENNGDGAWVNVPDGGASIATGLTASTTQTQAGALGLTAKRNFVSTVANASDSVRLPALQAGQDVTVFNDGANPMHVFPPVGANIDGAGANAAVTLTNAKRCTYFYKSATVIESAQLGVASA